MSILNKIFGDANEKLLKKFQPLMEKINSLEPEFEKLATEDLREKTSEFKKRIQKGESLDDLLPEVFALARETSKRTLNQRHFDVQLIGGIVLHQGKIAEMKTGEGKTLTATLSLYLNALEGKGCHLVTVNDYLAKRDTVWMGQIYHGLGLSTGCIVHEAAYLYDPEYQQEIQNSKFKIQNDNSKLKIEEKDKIRDTLGGFKIVESYLRPVSRKEAYDADITYGTNNEFVFDYLKDNMVYDPDQQVQRGFYYAIVDEVDSILIDEARTPLIISAPDIESSKWYLEFAKIIPKLDMTTDYEIDEKMRAVTLTETGINKIEKILGMENIYEEKGIKYLHHLEQSLKAEILFKKDKDYIVKDGQVIIIDEFTGRLMPGRRWSGGLHQAIEAKEGVMVQPESLTLASITFQNFFRMYKKLAGMTGTAITSAEEFDRVYNLDTVVIPTNKLMIRKDLPDKIYRTENGKLKAIVNEIKERHKSGQPVLVGTRSVEKNEYLGKLLEIEGIPHQILNAKHHEKEGEIIAGAGKIGAVTIATNMAGRGVDIILGGYPPSNVKDSVFSAFAPAGAKAEKEKQDRQTLNIKSEEDELYKKWKEEQEKVIALGGLHIIGTERHEARRIDNQLRGRSGRQGDPGSSQFFVSLEDDLMRIFGGEKIKFLMEKFKIPETQPIESSLVSQAIESVQTAIEGMNFDSRKYVLEYDDVLNKHREVIYKKRKEIMKIENWQLEIENWLEDPDEKKDVAAKIKELGDKFNSAAKVICLKVLDMFWTEHLENMEQLRDSVRLRAYGQQDPLIEYKNEGHKMFQELLAALKKNIVQAILKISEDSEIIKSRASGENQSESQKKIVLSGRAKIGRNDPCPCGATYSDGRPIKFKRCHGA